MCGTIWGELKCKPEIVVSSCTAVGIGFVEVAGIAVYGVYHVAFAICDDGWILGCDVVQELLHSCHCVGSGLHLLQSKCAEGGKDGAVDTTSISK